MAIDHSELRIVVTVNEESLRRLERVADELRRYRADERSQDPAQQPEPPEVDASGDTERGERETDSAGNEQDQNDDGHTEVIPNERLDQA